jgi:hypothetical protein
VAKPLAESEPASLEGARETKQHSQPKRSGQSYWKGVVLSEGHHNSAPLSNDGRCRTRPNNVSRRTDTLLPG